jgi:hypothetical protein
LSKRTYQFAGIHVWQFYKYEWLMRISEIFLLENLSINVPYHRLTTFLKSKMINIELFSVGSRDEFYLNIASYVSWILRHFFLFCWLLNSPFSNKDRVIYISIKFRNPNEEFPKGYFCHIGTKFWDWVWDIEKTYLSICENTCMTVL